LNKTVLVTRSQAFFQAFVLPNTLPAIDAQWIDHFHLSLPIQVGTSVRAWLGRGPVTHHLGVSAMLFFEGSDDAYPVFSYPSESPKGSGLKASKTTRLLVADEQTAIFCLEAISVTLVPPEAFDQGLAERLDDTIATLVQQTVATNGSILATIAGAYALYQYPLVWRPVEERHLYFFINPETKHATKSSETLRPDNFIPFKLNPAARIHDGLLADALITNPAQIIQAAISAPLVLLKDSMWHSDLRTRFLLQFWIIEYFAEKYSTGSSTDPDAAQLADALDDLVAQHLPQHLARFRSKKGEFTRRSLAEKAQAAFGHLRIEYDDRTFKRAKRVRDNLSHGSSYDSNDLVDMERYVREVARHFIRRDLELKGIFLDGIPTPVAELPVIVPSYMRALDERKHAAFGPL
jgi:hypothetical protein